MFRYYKIIKSFVTGSYPYAEINTLNYPEKKK